MAFLTGFHGKDGKKGGKLAGKGDTFNTA